MKAAITTKYGDPRSIVLREVLAPKPKPSQVLVRVHASAVTSADTRLRRADPPLIRIVYGVFTPRASKAILGSTFSGVVENVGSMVSKFKKGDAVFGTTDAQMGAHAEYLVISQDKTILSKPNNISHFEAAAIPFGFSTALHFLEKANIRKNDSILIIGASGSLGTAAVQLAKHFGAQVTAVCGPNSLELMSTLGVKKA